LEQNKITIHQAFYGEVSRAHSCIKQTIVDPELTSFLIAFTDRPAALPPGVSLLPYLSGSIYSRYFIFTKTYSDQTATRAGMVFTHAIIINQGDIESIYNLQDVFSLFIESTENKNDELKDIEIVCSKPSLVSGGRNQPKYIQQTISAFINGVNPILFSGDIATFSQALQQIWNSPNKVARKKVKFRTSFTPSDIENVNDLTIVSIQKDFLPKWHGHAIIHEGNQDVVEITSHSEALFLGYKEENPFHNFLLELNLKIEDVKNYGLYEKVFANYISVEIIDDANILRQDIRVLSKISPSPADGKRIKEKFIERLSKLIQNKKDTNIKALRNIDWAGFVDGERKGKQIVSEFIISEIENPNQKQFQSLSELIDLSLRDTTKNWWHASIKESVVSIFKKQNESSLKNIWLLMDTSETTLMNLLSIISVVKDCDSILRKSLPEKLKIETCKIFAPITQKKNWYLLHADILLKYLSINIALEKQLEVEQKLPLADSVGVKFIVEQLSSEKLIQCALKDCNTKLIELSVEEVLKNVTLLKDIDLSVSGWLDIWSSLVLKTRNIFAGLKGKEQATVFLILDLLIKGKNVDTALIGLIADTNFSDISEYKNRSKIWGVVTPNHKEKFLTSTAQSVLKNLLSGKIQVASIESEIADRISSDVFMTNFLSENRDNIEPVIILYSSFNNLKDNFLADYIANFPNAVTEEQTIKLGDLIKKYKFNKSARSIYDKARYNHSFKSAYENCKELVTLNWWESFNIFGTPSKELFKDNPHIHSGFQKEQLIRNELPTVVILTAIKEEYLAVRLHLNEIVPAKQNDTHYEAGIFEFNGKEIAKIIIRECGAKNTTSAIETERAIQYFKPNAMFFVGIAGSRKPKDFSIGDVIFPEVILSYEGGKSEKESFLARPDIGVLTYAILETAKAERKKEDWKMLIKNSIDPKSVKADIGIIASGEQVVEHYESEVGKILTKHYNQTSAVEMEGFGFAKTINRQGRETSNIMTGIVRGISDIIEQPSKTNKKKDIERRPANAKQIASDTAAAFAFWLILKTYE
jgi:nucleoside phosphorylase